MIKSILIKIIMLLLTSSLLYILYSIIFKLLFNHKKVEQ